MDEFFIFPDFVIFTCYFHFKLKSNIMTIEFHTITLITLNKNIQYNFIRHINNSIILYN